MSTSKSNVQKATIMVGALGWSGLAGCTYVEAPARVTEDDTAADDYPNTSADGEGGAEEEESSSGGEPEDPTDCAQVEVDALNVLQTYCAGCHKPGPNPPGNFDYVTDLERLELEGKVVSGDSAASPLFIRMDSGQMPPPAAAAFPTDGEIWTISQWIDECLPQGGGGAAACEPDHRIGIDGMLAAINDDLIGEVDQENRENIRYFTLSHLYDAGLCGDELDVYRRALAKTINSLSTGPSVAAPVAIDADETIYRIDLGDYGWDAALWASLASQSPYGIQFDREEALDIQEFTNENIPILRGDWLAAEATTAPLYNELLLNRVGGEDLFNLQAALNVFINNNIDDEIDTNNGLVARAGFQDSGVSQNNRMIERHEIPAAGNQVFWISYDFANDADNENIFVNPLDFDEAGSEVIFSLPNGLHGYLIVNNIGERLNVGPNNVVTDANEPTGEVFTARSCLRCHDSGLNFADDELGAFVASSSDFDAATKEAVENLHPEKADFQALLQKDSDNYTAALAAAGVQLGGSEPIGSVFEWYDGNVDFTLAAGEFGISEDELLLRVADIADGQLAPLATGTVQRDTFELNFAQAVCDLQLGLTNACP
jgi:serine/threonine-protein kinase